MVPISTSDLITWLDNLWANYLTDSKGMPICKVHGFGLTSFVLMFRYPWYSVDSTSWVVTGRMGSIFVPRKKQGVWTYDENAWKICVSNRSPSKSETGQHFDTLPQNSQKIISEYLLSKGYKIGKSEFKKEPGTYILKDNEKWVGKKPAGKNDVREVEIIIEEGVSNKYQLRDEVNIIYYQDLEKTMQAWPWSFTITESQQKLF